MKTLFIVILLSIVACGQDCYEWKEKDSTWVVSEDSGDTYIDYIQTVNYRIKIFQNISKIKLEKTMNNWLSDNSEIKVSAITHGTIQTEKDKFDRMGYKLHEHVITIVYREYNYSYQAHRFNVKTKVPVKIKLESR